MASIVGICNVGLTMIGANPIIALDEGTKNANLCSTYWEQTLDAVLRDHPWNCAINRVQLNQSATAPVWGYSYQYTLPTDPYCLRVLKTNNDHLLDDLGNLQYPWEVEGRMLKTNADSVMIKYIKRITDPNEFDTLLLDALACAMAKKLAFPVTRSLQTSQAMMNLYLDALMRAKQVDAQEGDVDVLESDVLWNARW